MKKFLLILVAVLGISVVASAQPRALGVRVGYGAELSYQHSLSDNFLEFDLGLFGNNSFNLVAAYDFSVAPVGPFNFYIGPAADLLFVGDTDDAEGGLGIGVGGQLGLEYIFDFPLQISLDWRPMFNFIHGGFGWYSVGLGLRYAF